MPCRKNLPILSYFELSVGIFGPQLLYEVVFKTPLLAMKPGPNSFCTWGSLFAAEELILLATLTVKTPSAPFLVVMMTTPSAALDPYKAAAAAPFNTDMLATS